MRSSFREEKKRFCGKELAKSSIINKREMSVPFDGAFFNREETISSRGDSALQ